MATPALRLLRSSLKGSFIGALCRPGIDELLDGSDLVDELHVERGGGVFGPKLMAAKVRPRLYDTALLLTNSFSTALVTRIAGIPRRIGDAAESILHEHLPRYNALCPTPIPLAFPPGIHLELGISATQQAGSDAVLLKAGIAPGEQFAVLNPGGNNPAKRWPAERFAQLADHLHTRHQLRVLVNGSPSEHEVIESVISGARSARPVNLATCGISLGALKGVLADAAILITNDTGPRHIAAALGVPLVALFGPTDHRWTTIPTRPRSPECIVTADPTLPERESANDHPLRCAIEKITLETVIGQVDHALNVAAAGEVSP